MATGSTFGAGSPDPAEGAAPRDGRLLRPAASCPRCGSRPALRVTSKLVTAVGGEALGARLGTFQCQRRGCGTIYDLLAEHCARAS